MGRGLTRALKRRLIPRHSRKVLPNPPRHLLICVDADHAPRHRVLHPVPARRRRRQRPGIARTHDQDVPEARLRALGRERPLQLREADGRAAEGVVGRGRGVLLREGQPAGDIDEDAAADDALGRPRCGA